MTTASNKEALLIKAIKDAHALRQLLFDRTEGYSREEMLGANALIQKATEEWVSWESSGRFTSQTSEIPPFLFKDLFWPTDTTTGDGFPIDPPVRGGLRFVRRRIERRDDSGLRRFDVERIGGEEEVRFGVGVAHPFAAQRSAEPFKGDPAPEVFPALRPEDVVLPLEYVDSHPSITSAASSAATARRPSSCHCSSVVRSPIPITPYHHRASERTGWTPQIGARSGA